MPAQAKQKVPRILQHQLHLSGIDNGFVLVAVVEENV
jgi:hypothetical protein